MEEEQDRNWFVIILIIALIWALFFHKQEYEGQTAEEWFYEYDYQVERYERFRSCVEDYDSLSMREQIDYGGVFYYCE